MADNSVVIPLRTNERAGLPILAASPVVTFSVYSPVDEKGSTTILR